MAQIMSTLLSMQQHASKMNKKYAHLLTLFGLIVSDVYGMRLGDLRRKGHQVGIAAFDKHFSTCRLLKARYASRVMVKVESRAHKAVHDSTKPDFERRAESR